jgi:hypothetical protein
MLRDLVLESFRTSYCSFLRYLAIASHDRIVVMGTWTTIVRVPGMYRTGGRQKATEAILSNPS